jgi:hypothetical protein
MSYEVTRVREYRTVLGARVELRSVDGSLPLGDEEGKLARKPLLDPLLK